MKITLKVSPEVSLRIVFKGKSYKLYKQELFHALETNATKEEDVKEFLESLVKMRFINSYEFVKENNVSNNQENQVEKDDENTSSEEVEQSSNTSENTSSKSTKKKRSKNS